MKKFFLNMFFVAVIMFGGSILSAVNIDEEEVDEIVLSDDQEVPHAHISSLEDVIGEEELIEPSDDMLKNETFLTVGDTKSTDENSGDDDIPEDVDNLFPEDNE